MSRRQLALYPFELVWRPHLLSIMIYEVRCPHSAKLSGVSDSFQGVLFGFSIGMNLTNSLFLGEPRPLGYGYGQDTIATIFIAPIVRLLSSSPHSLHSPAAGRSRAGPDNRPLSERLHRRTRHPAEQGYL